MQEIRPTRRKRTESSTLRKSAGAYNEQGCLRGSDAYGRSPGEPVFDGEQRMLRNPVACRIAWKRPRREDARVTMQAPLAQIPREEIWATRLEYEAHPPVPVDVDRALPMPVVDEIVQDAR